ncbi:MAG TPA: cupin domain-containing protein [Rhizomicrobium sp.]|jgi:quercetin dioxygenase-like cupin family protein|nr:cupin domain-containing protein [Rhizomicrobium sp.]
MKHWISVAAGVAMIAAAPLNFTVDVPTTGTAQQVVYIEHDFAPGEGTGLHIHHGIEMSYVMRGTVRVKIHDKPPFVVRKGGSFRVEREVPHEAVNIGRDQAALIIAYVVDQGRPLKEPWPPKK